MEIQNELIALMPIEDLLVVLEGAGYNEETIPGLLSRASLSPSLLSDNVGFVDPTQVWRLFSYIGYELDDEWCGLVSHKLGSGTTELVAARAMQCDTLGEAMVAMANALTLVLPELKVDVKRRLNELHFSMSFRDSPSEAQKILLELSCMPYHATFCWLAGKFIQVSRFRTDRSRENKSMNILAVFNSDVQFEGAGISMVYPRVIESLAVSPPKLKEWRSDIYKIFLEDIERRKNSFSSSRLQLYVVNALRQGVHDQEAVAASAAMSVATMRRKLSRERVSFRELSDDVFREKSHKYIEAGLSVDEIAIRMNYSDASSYRRAYRRIFGHTLASHRAG